MRQKNSNLLIALISMVLSMLCLSYASVPLYRIFCKATGYGGTTKKSTVITKNRVSNQQIKVRFSADTHNIPLMFYPQQQYVMVSPGIEKLVFYIAENLSNQQITGTAVYNVTPYQAGKYFNKIACFCFSQQTFPPGHRTVMPISFFLDPEIEKDPTTKEISEITLSYTFFSSDDT